MTGDVQPLGEYPEVSTMLGVIKAIDHLRDTGQCGICGDTGRIQYADVYRNLAACNCIVLWELSRVIPCSCQYREALCTR